MRIAPTLVLLLLPLSGCARTIGKGAQVATPIITTEMIDGIYSDRAMLGRLMTDPSIVHGTSALGAAAVRGAIDELEHEMGAVDLRRASEDFWNPLRSGMKLELHAELGPELAPILSESFDHSLQTALDDETRERARAFALSISEATAEGFVRGMGDELFRRIGDEAPSVELEKIARAASRGAALGFQDAVQETATRRLAGNERPGDVLGLASEAADVWLQLLRVLPILLSGLAVAVSVGAIAMLARLHRDVHRLLERPSQPPQRPSAGGGHAYAGE